MKVIYNPLLPFKGFSAINLFGVIFARTECRPLSKRTINHEAIHTAQMKELFYLGFYVWYITEWVLKLAIHGKRSYQNISFEREAYTWMSRYSYLQKRGKYAFLKYL
ncbi:MAG: hypothetical protein LBM08_09505 [Dysgonamonadaceae bacterium]|jgi:hypothetical protein|nr:hypothetical protein [Dysgonamonadaceae bacterium]